MTITSMVVGLLCCGGCFTAAWTGHNDPSREEAEDIQGALRDCGLSIKAASIEMRLADEKQLSRQLAGAEPLNHFRLWYLPLEFRIALARRQMARLGADIVTAEQRDFILSCASLGVDKLSHVFSAKQPQRKVS